MTNGNEASPPHDESPPEAATETSDPESLTDLIDRLDRAAFRRALSERDASRQDYQEETARRRLARNR